jgi:hypothetical protein
MSSVTDFFPQLAIVLPILRLATSAPTGPPTFETTTNFTITTGGTHGNQGAHPIVPSIHTNAKNPVLAARNGVGSVVTGAGLNWYTSSFSTGGSGNSDPQHYTCYNGPASNFPSFSSWMNFYDMFDLNQADSMVYEESGPLQGDLWNSIVQVAANSEVDARFILAVIMQEVSFMVSVILKKDSS